MKNNRLQSSVSSLLYLEVNSAQGIDQALLNIELLSIRGATKVNRVEAKSITSDISRIQKPDELQGQLI